MKTDWGTISPVSVEHYGKVMEGMVHRWNCERAVATMLWFKTGKKPGVLQIIYVTKKMVGSCLKFT